MDQIKVLAFDTGGTILDWHAGIVRVLAQIGARCGIERDCGTRSPTNTGAARSGECSAA